MKKRISAFLLALMMTLTLTAGVLAVGNREAISAQLWPDITICYNGQERKLQDADGDPCYPIVYRERTYLPIRAVSEMLDIPVDWEGSTQTVLIGTRPEDILRPDITILYNGQEQQLWDDNGVQVYPLVYGGTTYLPVRAVSGMLGLPVDWEKNTQTVFLGRKPGETQALLDVCPPYEKSEPCRVYTGEQAETFRMAGDPYSNGIVFADREDFALFNLGGRYDTLTFVCGHIDGEAMDAATISIFLDGELIRQIEMTGESMPQAVTIPLDHARQLKIGVGSAEHSNAAYGLAELVVE